jgi:hypothetical protein
MDTVTLAYSFTLLEGINTLHFFDQVAPVLSHHLMKIIFLEGLINKQRDVFVAARVARIRLELRDATRLELTQESWILTPEQANVRNVEEQHCKPFEPES